MMQPLENGESQDCRAGRKVSSWFSSTVENQGNGRNSRDVPRYQQGWMDPCSKELGQGGRKQGKAEDWESETFGQRLSAGVQDLERGDMGMTGVLVG